ncbi:uncharacterized protein LOC144161733 [Haemaphysalis longicornis]
MQPRSHGETKLLLLACAAVGLPPVLFLDEPLSDVQPPYHHEVIRALQVLRSTRATSIIITSYRMSLCELVCDRVAVIKAAKVEALGDAEEMNHKYGRCYTVTVRLPPGRHYDYDLQSSVLLKVQEEFHEATLQQLYEWRRALSSSRMSDLLLPVERAVAAGKADGVQD